MDLAERPRGSFRRHPWEVARFRFFHAVLRAAGVCDRPRRVLDVGSGDAWCTEQLLGVLPPSSSAACWDAAYTPDDVRAADVRGLPLTCCPERPSGRFDLVLLLDVVEHVADDRGFVAGIVEQSLAPDGLVLLSVPAWPGLYGPHDRRLRHHRRYAPRQALDLLASAGLRPLRHGGLFHLLLAPRALEVLRHRLVGEGAATPGDLGTWRHGAAVTTAVGAVLAADNACSRLASRLRLDVPGLSWWALCTRR